MAATLQASPLLERFRPVLSKRAGLSLAIWGEAGIGKSFQAQALLRALPCRSLSLAASTPFAKLALALPRPPKLASWAERTLTRAGAGERLEPEALAAAFGAVLAGLTPFVLHLEDLHEASPQGLEFALHLARSLPKIRGAGLLVTSRSEPGEAFVPVRLEPLSREASDRLLETEVGAALPPEACAWMHCKAAGNPLYTLEFFRYLARQGFLWNDGGRWRWRKPPEGFLPATVEALIERLLADAKSSQVISYVLETRALLPAEVGYDAWLKTARVGAEELRAASRHLEQQGIFTRSAFSHPLFRELTLKTLSPERRRHLARRTVNALQDEPELAAQFVDDAELESERALELLRRAAESAKDGVRAARFRAQAVRYAEGEEQGRLALESARVLDSLDRPEATRLFAIALEVYPEEPEIVYHLAAHYAEAGRKQEVAELLGRLPQTERTRLGWVKRALSLRFSLADYQGLLELWQAHPQLHQEADPELGYQVGFARVIAGDYQEAEAAARPLLAPSLTSIARARLLTVCGLARFYRHDEAAEALLDEAVAAARDSGQLDYLASTLHNRSMFYEENNREAEMLSDTEEALRLYAEIGLSRHYASTRTKQARILHELGHYERAEEAFQESREILARGDHSAFLITCDAHLSDLYLDWQPSYGTALAYKHAHSAVQAARALGGRKLVLALYSLSLVESRQGRADQGLALADECAALALRFEAEPAYQGVFARGVALESLGEVQRALEHYQQAEKLARNSDWRVYAEKIGLELDRLTNDLGSARERLAWFEEHGLLNGANLAKRYFPDLAAPLALPSEARLLPRLELLGPMQLRAEGLTPIRGRKRQELLALLLEARVSGRSEVSRLALLDALYPNEDEAKAGSSLKELVHGLRESLGATLILTTSGGYALGEYASDVEQFLATAETSLWRGLYLDGLELESPVRESLYLALERHADALLESDPQEAARLGKLLLEAEPYSLDGLKSYLGALRRLGNHRSLERHYQRARERMLEVGETLPSHWQDFLSSGEKP